jgi:hypothetical protein
MTLSVGAVVVRPSHWRCHIDLSEEASSAKHHAKAIPGSTLYIHELVNDPPCALIDTPLSVNVTE